MGNCIEPQLDPEEYFVSQDGVFIMEIDETMDDYMLMKLAYKDHEFTFRKYSNGKTQLESPHKGSVIYNSMDLYMAAMERVVAGGSLLPSQNEKCIIHATIWAGDSTGKQEVRFELIGLDGLDLKLAIAAVKQLCNLCKVNVGSLSLRHQMIAVVTESDLEAMKACDIKHFTFQWMNFAPLNGTKN